MAVGARRSMVVGSGSEACVGEGWRWGTGLMGLHWRLAFQGKFLPCANCTNCPSLGKVRSA